MPSSQPPRPPPQPVYRWCHPPCTAKLAAHVFLRVQAREPLSVCDRHAHAAGRAIARGMFAQIRDGRDACPTHTHTMTFYTKHRLAAFLHTHMQRRTPTQRTVGRRQEHAREGIQGLARETPGSGSRGGDVVTTHTTASTLYLQVCLVRLSLVLVLVLAP